MSLIEVLVTALFLAVAIGSAAPLYVLAQRNIASSRDMGSVAALATRRQELLRAQKFDDLTAGGSLSSNVPGYSDTSDPDYVFRWQIIDNAARPTIKSITVRAIATRQVAGAAKEIQLSTMRAR